MNHDDYGPGANQRYVTWFPLEKAIPDESEPIMTYSDEYGFQVAWWDHRWCFQEGRGDVPLHAFWTYMPRAPRRIPFHL